jgi:hypothetical protein
LYRVGVLTLTKFRSSLHAKEPPDGLTAPLLALWHDGHGDWDAAHKVAQDIETADGSWIHAYLHRKEGDASNAAYWYRRADKPVSHASLDDEWAEIAGALISRQG